MTRTYSKMMSFASASSANAFSCCAHTVRNIAMVLGAIIVASIIICTLAVRLCTLSLLALVLLVLVEKANTPTARLTA